MTGKEGTHNRALTGGIDRDEALKVLECPQEEILELVNEAREVKEVHWGNSFSFCSIINAKSGLCDAGCIFCAQAYPQRTHVPVYPLVSPEEMVKGAMKAAEARASRYSIVISGRSPKEREFSGIVKGIEKIRQKTSLIVDVSLGILIPHQLKALREGGVDRVHHNLETSERFYPQVTSRIQWKDKRTFVERVQEMGFSLCCGAILGIGEQDEDRVDLAFTLKEMGVDSVPLNFLIPIPGTPLEGKRDLDPIHCLRIVAMFRLVLPETEIRICGGREAHLRDFQSLAAIMVNGFMVGGYLTRPGRDPALDLQLVEDLGLQLV